MTVNAKIIWHAIGRRQAMPTGLLDVGHAVVEEVGGDDTNSDVERFGAYEHAAYICWTKLRLVHRDCECFDA